MLQAIETAAAHVASYGLPLAYGLPLRSHGGIRLGGIPPTGHRAGPALVGAA
ncbi:hypothetical protein [Streptomyces sp. TLI_105]|uniref:hypothetical protein n=1 Tax=Streptomyces sp. TLI_105 TaxID=1881019 RepID=UPI000898B621|nr:hypothetical protein [Streptomyces sp. TLI_105]SED92982.1 hypothetical protein SAMN05428939_6764 [Streptomyces sp. TLI_105]